jgi:hypothetical protein
MKVKVGFTLPLTPDRDRSVLVLPYIAERNFAYAPGLKVSVWAESNAPISCDALWKETISGAKTQEGFADKSRQLYAARGEVTPPNLASTELYMPSPKPDETVYRSEFSGVTAYSSLEEVSPMSERLVAVVLDTSLSVGKYFAASGGFGWETVLRKLPDGARVALFAGGLDIPPMTREDAVREWTERIGSVKFQGADEQTGSLERAWDLCASEGDAAVLWIHAKLPVVISDTTALEQRLRRRPNAGEAGSPAIFSLQIDPGANRLEEKISGLKRLPPRYGRTLEERLSNVFAMSLYPGFNDRERVFSSLAPAHFRTVQSSPHIARLAYAGEISRKISSGGTATDEETAKAREMRIVTEATGAVVLENRQQFEEHDLDPAFDLKSVPTIPEPEEYALMAVVSVLLAITFLRRRARHHETM